ncbi:BTB/POZ domain-containing protein, partial [Escherichia coli]|uniref:BTB/POZ domain-containing protein n=1 Tax=Escherichia coli TaxID=562 RepID=UPI0035944340
SPVFADLFDDADADVDASTGRLTITIDDVTVENFQLLLEYIYNDKIDDEKLTAELLTAADKVSCFVDFSLKNSNSFSYL